MTLTASTLKQIMARVRERWPELEVEARSFAAHLEHKLTLLDSATDADVDEALQALHIEDLALAYACAQGSRVAIQQVQTIYEQQIEQALKRIDMASAQREDAYQQLNERLFVGSLQNPARISQYSGRGPLGRWLQVSATREALNMLRGVHREVCSEDRLLEQAVSPSADHEMRYLKGIYSMQFKQAFEQALRNLEARDRLLLRCNLVDNMSIDQIGAMFGVHRATAARWLERVRQTLSLETRSLLMQAIRIDNVELDSIMNLIHSQLDASVQRILLEDDGT